MNPLFRVIVCIVVLLHNEKEIGVLGVLDNATFPRVANIYAYYADPVSVPWFAR